MQSDLEQLFTQLVSSLVESIQESLGSVHTMVDEYASLVVWYCSIRERNSKRNDTAANLRNAEEAIESFYRCLESHE